MEMPLKYLDSCHPCCGPGLSSRLLAPAPPILGQCDHSGSKSVDGLSLFLCFFFSSLDLTLSGSSSILHLAAIADPGCTAGFFPYMWETYIEFLALDLGQTQSLQIYGEWAREHFPQLLFLSE